MKVKLSGWACSSKIYIVQEVQPNEKIETVKCKLEKILPCTKITRIFHDRRPLDINYSFENYAISNGTLLEFEINTEANCSKKAACMGCSYHNLMYLLANVARAHEAISYFNHEITKVSIHRWIEKLNSKDQIKIKSFLNFVTDGLKIRFMVCVKDMLELYVQNYRNIEYANLIDFDYCQLLNELRCPICNVKFHLYSQSSTIPIELCTVSYKHYTCYKCFEKVQRCPLCNGKLHEKAFKSDYAMNQLLARKKQIEEYCLPATLNTIRIEDNRRPFAHGAFCNVFKVGSYAVKCPRVPALIDDEVESAIMHEIFLSRPLSHIPNILIVYGGVRLPDYGMSIVTELVDGPNLAQALFDDTIFNLAFEQRLDIALGICKGLGELHLAGIVHRDFKPANILLQKVSTRNAYVPKIADFGVSFLIQTASATAVKKLGGTVGYDAPEVAEGNIPTNESDIYALAFTLYELITSQKPFAGLKDAQIITKFTLKGGRPSNWNILAAVDQTVQLVPDQLKDAIERGWLNTPEDRSTIGELICAIRKTIKPNYIPCVRMISTEFHCSAKDSSFDFIEKYDTFELLAIQEIIKRLVIEDSNAVELLLDNYAWG